TEQSAPWGITLELLQTQFSKHLKDAANDLGIGSTTLKRICRQYGIARWPRRSLKSKQYKEVKEEVKRQKKEVKLSQARSGGGGSSMRGGSSFRSSGWSGSDEAVEGKSVHGGQAGGKESLFGQANVAVVNSKSGQQLGANELFTMGYTGALLEMGGSGDDGNHEEEGRAHGGFRFAGIRDIATRQFDFDEDDEPDRGASWHAGSGFVAT
ncbi:RWP-RK domain-containing protein, partial [Pseudomonas aeruginosa]|uniref:RWP-RK domain-containing protein n=1 Tax=Pseudomonas aeruginosa TaxID=287 RepID=UPI0013CDE486